jgi:hypothetical protein
MLDKKRRQVMVDWILKVIRACNETGAGINEEHLIAECCLTFYCGERLVKELLKQLKLTGKVREEYDELFIVEIKNKTEAVKPTGNPVLDLPVSDKNTRGGL